MQFLLIQPGVEGAKWLLPPNTEGTEGGSAALGEADPGSTIDLCSYAFDIAAISQRRALLRIPELKGYSGGGPRFAGEFRVAFYIQADELAECAIM